MLKPTWLCLKAFWVVVAVVVVMGAGPGAGPRAAVAAAAPGDAAAASAAELTDERWWLRRAGEEAARIDDAEDQVRALCMIAEGQAGLGDVAGGLQTLTTAERQAAGIEDERSRDRRYDDIAELWAEFGDQDKALALAARISDEGRAESVRRRIAEIAGDEAQDEASVGGPFEQIRSLLMGEPSRGVRRSGGGADQAQPVERAAALVEAVDDPAQRAWAMQMVASAWAAQGQRDTAWEIAQTITDPAAQSAAYLALLRAGVQDDQAWSQRCLDAAFEAARAVADAPSRIGALTHVAGAQLALGRHDAARVTLDLTASAAERVSGREHVHALVSIVPLRVAADDTPGAAAAAKRIDDPFDRGWAWCTVARGWLAAKDTAAVGAALGAAGDAAASMDDADAYWRDMLLVQIATVYAEADRLDAAHRAVARAATPDARQVARYQMTLARAAAGDVEGAQAVAMRMDDPFWRVWVYPDAVAAAVEGDAPDTAAALLTGVDDPVQTRALDQAIYRARVRLGEIDPVQAATGAGDGDAALVAVAEAQAAAGQVQAAQQTIATITDRRQRGRASWTAVRILLEADNLDGARVIAEGIDSRWRRWILADIAAGYARRHDMQAIAQWCDAEPAPENRAMICVGAARGLYETK